MHGFHQGSPFVSEAITNHSPDIFLLQEHWLTPSNLHLFNKHFPGYFLFVSSSMANIIEGMLRGRPYGGVAILVNNSLCKLTKGVHCSDRYAIVQTGDCLFVNF